MAHFRFVFRKLKADKKVLDCLLFILQQNTQNNLMLSRKLLSDICIKEHNLVCNDDENSINNEFSETLFKVLDKVCITLEARQNSSPDGELTDQN